MIVVHDLSCSAHPLISPVLPVCADAVQIQPERPAVGAVRSSDTCLDIGGFSGFVITHPRTGIELSASIAPRAGARVLGQIDVTGLLNASGTTSASMRHHLHLPISCSCLACSRIGFSHTGISVSASASRRVTKFSSAKRVRKVAPKSWMLLAVAAARSGNALVFLTRKD
jgi:hypothetical protein